MMKQAEKKAADIVIRAAGKSDADVVWQIIEPVIRSGETYALPSDMTADDAIGYWFAPGHQVFLAAEGSEAVGTYFLCANNRGGGDHVTNAGYVTAAPAQGRGIARAMCLHSIEQARSVGFLAMQFNFVVATNTGAVRLWQSLGFDIVGRLPEAFRHPGEGMVDALIMYRCL